MGWRGGGPFESESLEEIKAAGLNSAFCFPIRPVGCVFLVFLLKGWHQVGVSPGCLTERNGIGGAYSESNHRSDPAVCLVVFHSLKNRLYFSLVCISRDRSHYWTYFLGGESANGGSTHRFGLLVHWR